MGYLLITLITKIQNRGSRYIEISNLSPNAATDRFDIYL